MLLWSTVYMPTGIIVHWFPLPKKFRATGDGWCYVLVALAAFCLLPKHDSYVPGLLMAFAIERPVYYLLKNVLRRNRPYRTLAIKNWVNPGDKFSFPSGHTSAAFTFAVLTASAFPLLLIPMMIWAVCVGCSRVVLGVHFPTDILVGALMGISIAQFVLVMI